MMVGLLNNGVEHFLGVLLLLLLLLLGVVGECTTRGFGDCKDVKGRGGGGGIDGADCAGCTFDRSEKDGDCGRIKEDGGGGGGGGGGGARREGEDEEGQEKNEGTGCENFDRISSNVSRNFFSSCISVILSSLIFLLASWTIFISIVRVLRVASVLVRNYAIEITRKNIINRSK